MEPQRVYLNKVDELLDRLKGKKINNIVKLGDGSVHFFLDDEDPKKKFLEILIIKQEKFINMAQLQKVPQEIIIS